MKAKPMSVAFCSMAALACLIAGDDGGLVKNGSFTELGPGGAPLSWKVTGTAESVSVDSAEHPESCPKSLKVVVENAPGDYGAVTQDIPWNGTDAKMLLTADMKSSKKGMAFLQVKLKKGKEEFKRLASELSDVQWGQAKVEFDTEGADRISVQFRFKTAEFPKESAWLANVKLVERK